MYVIETDLGRFEADTEREAKKALRAAKAAAQRQERIDAENRAAANRMAESRGYAHYHRHHEQGPVPAHSWLVTPDSRHFPASQDSENPRQWRIKISDDAVCELYSYQPIAMLLRANGDVDLLWTQDMESPERIYCMAMGHCGDMVGHASLPIELFPVEAYQS